MKKKKLRMIFFLLFVYCFAFSRLPHRSKFVPEGLGPDNSTQISGYITVNGSVFDGTHLFYWFFESRNDPENAPFVVWLTGGPGCSSMMALVSENGPYNIKEDGTLDINPYSWNEAANVMWVDQPAGTGYSYIDNVLDYDVNEKQVARDMWNFLQEFMTAHPKYKNMDLYLIGESYAGHYVPAIAWYEFFLSTLLNIVRKVYDANENGEGKLRLNLKGIGIGNGLVDPYHQYPAYAEFAMYNKLINTLEYVADEAAAKICQKLINTGVWEVAFYECQIVAEGILEEISVHQGFQINPYNYKIPCKKPPLCYDFSGATKFFNEESTMKALGVKEGKKWESCNMAVHFAMLGDWMRNLEVHIPTLLENKIRVLVYSGENDYICNWKGGEAWTAVMPWSGKSEFNKQKYTAWNVDGKEAGQYKAYDTLTFLRVANAGHMVPMDQPSNALSMLKTFLDDKPF